MATTRIMSVHSKAGMSLGAALGITTDYVENPDKTEDKRYVSSYMCDPETATEEFVLQGRCMTEITASGSEKVM